MRTWWAAADAELPKGATLTVLDQHAVLLARYPDAGSRVGTVVPDAPLVRAIAAARGEGTVDAVGPELGSDRGQLAVTVTSMTSEYVPAASEPDRLPTVTSIGKDVPVAGVVPVPLRTWTGAPVERSRAPPFKTT